MEYFHSTGSTSAACAFHCNTANGYYYDSENNECADRDEWCKTDTLYGCQNPATATHTSSSNNSKYTWDCALA